MQFSAVHPRRKATVMKHEGDRNAHKGRETLKLEVSEEWNKRLGETCVHTVEAWKC